MTLLEEIEKDLTDSSIPLSDILRKAKILAKRLKSDEVTKWLESELNGYPQDETIPGYRKIRTQIRGDYFSRGFKEEKHLISLSRIPEKLRESMIVHVFHEGIRGIESLVEAGHEVTMVHFPPEITMAFNDERKTYSQAWQQISKAQLELILDTIRTRLLNFVLEIEELDPMAGEKSGTRIGRERVNEIFERFVIFNIGRDLTGGDHYVGGDDTAVESIEHRTTDS